MVILTDGTDGHAAAEGEAAHARVDTRPTAREPDSCLRGRLWPRTRLHEPA